MFRFIFARRSSSLLPRKCFSFRCTCRQSVNHTLIDQFVSAGSSCDETARGVLSSRLTLVPRTCRLSLPLAQRFIGGAPLPLSAQASGTETNGLDAGPQETTARFIPLDSTLQETPLTGLWLVDDQDARLPAISSLSPAMTLAAETRRWTGKWSLAHMDDGWGNGTFCCFERSWSSSSKPPSRSLLSAPIASLLLPNTLLQRSYTLYRIYRPHSKSLSLPPLDYV